VWLAKVDAREVYFIVCLVEFEKVAVADDIA
jgi:hypothetical protein